MNGTIKSKVEGKAFGFIAVENEADVFFHSTNVEGVSFDELKIGDAVTFEIEQADKGPRAMHVQRA